jgi:chromosome segregation ATPase
MTPDDQAFALQQEWRAMIVSKLNAVEVTMAAVNGHLTNLRLEVVTHKHKEDIENRLNVLEERIAELEKVKLKAVATIATLNAVAVIAWVIFTHFW